MNLPARRTSPRDARRRGRAGFTLVELLVAAAILAILLPLLFSMIGNTTSIWQRSSSKIQSFQESRAAFESMSKKLAQATLNTYWDYEYDAGGNPTRYKRQSELHLISGNMEALVGSNTTRRPTHGIFFQAPTGTANTPYGSLKSLLNACGYFVEFGSDSADRPDFLNSGPNAIAANWRFRLREVVQPSENLSIYSLTSGNSSWGENGTASAWFAPWVQTVPVGAAAPPTRTLAENVVALALLPRLSQNDDVSGTALAPAFFYDSRKSFTYVGKDKNGAVLVTGDSRHQLPPLVQVAMVAIDERSARRLADASGTAAPDLGLDTLFLDANKLADDLKTLEANLVARRLTHRVFTTTVALKGAKWSNN